MAGSSPTAGALASERGAALKTSEQASKVRRPRFVVVLNIPSPYRLHFLRELNRRLEGRGFDLHAHFQAKMHPDFDNWRLGSEDLGFPCTFWRDVLPRNRQNWHLNPGLLMHLVLSYSDILLVGGPWMTPTSALATVTGRRGFAIGWVEGNTLTPGRVSGLYGALKAKMLEKCDVIAAPGREGRGYVSLLEPLCGSRINVVDLPNVIDESLFRPATDRLAAGRLLRERLGLGGGDRMAIWPARLEPVKGIVEFLEGLSAEDLRGWRLVIIGKGSLKPVIEGTIRERGLSSHVRVLDPVAYEAMPAYYAAADLFILASMKDLWPLSVVEALHSGLPLLLSCRLGNASEALEGGGNGWSFDPADKRKTREAARSAFDSDRESLQQMGLRSAELAARRWRSAAVVDGFLDEVFRIRKG